MFDINIFCFMSNFSFKGDTLYQLIPSGDGLIHLPDSLIGDTISRDTGAKRFHREGPMTVKDLDLAIIVV